jgi:effector-binding domain-containing protein
VQGDYGKLPDRQAVVLKMFEEQQLARGGSVTLLFNDPRNTDKKDQKARVGYLIEAGATVRDPLTVAEIPAREVLVARIKAQPLLAPGKAYSALIAWLEKNRLPYRTPTLEIYRDSEMVVEMETMK